jgi:hypothetical protein
MEALHRGSLFYIRTKYLFCCVIKYQPFSIDYFYNLNMKDSFSTGD